MNKFIRDKVRMTATKLKEQSVRTLEEFQELLYIKTEPKKAQEMPDFNIPKKKLKRFERLVGTEKHYWFFLEFNTPGVGNDEELFLEFRTGHEGEHDAVNPQGLVYVNGKMQQGLDVNHRRVYLEPFCEYKILVYFYTGLNTDAFVPVYDSAFMADLKIENREIKGLYYDILVPYEGAMCLDREDYNHINTIRTLENVCNIIDFSDIGSEDYYKSIKDAREYIKEAFYDKACGNSEICVSYVGHTHIDVAFLWTVAQTREKVQRSFSTVLTLMERYPEYIFMSSQPQLYEFLKEEAPKTYERVKERIKEGRWEAEGAMWLEADCNLASGESLIRQIMHGKKFMMDEFGVDNKILWLPDVFGYSAALPQILKKTGVEKFVTSKISWSETNQMPYDSFIWEGIDGSEIFTYFLTAQNHDKDMTDDAQTTYVGFVTPSMHLGTWKRYQQKEYNNEVLVTYGYGDGGGGPTEEMIETEQRLRKGLPGFPKSKQTRASDFLERVEKNFNEACSALKRTPRWVGDLYLEFHRGTYTSMAKNKRYNRKGEFLCRDTEMLSVADLVLNNSSYPKEALQRSWKTLLLNQFHDIIPGSSIYQVYEQTDIEYGELFKELSAVKKQKIENIAKNVNKSGVLVYNPNSFEDSGYVEFEGKLIWAEAIPPLGWKVIEEDAGNDMVSVLDKTIENAYYVVTFDDNFNIISVYDKENKREVTEAGKCSNVLCAYEDIPRNFDNWEITDYYKIKCREINNIISFEKIECGNYGGFKIRRRYINSVIEQSILLYGQSRRIDFKTNVDWHESHTLLKTVFNLDIHSKTAAFETQFGSVEHSTHENTSWDQAKFEVCGHKWADISEETYGVSLLNDCKYGYSAKGKEMTLSLIKCGTFPNPRADQGMHEFTYSLYPHKDGFKRGGTVREGYRLNCPMEAVLAPGNGAMHSEYSLVSCENENIIIETVKQSEDGTAIIIRFYDTWNIKSKVSLKFGFLAERIYLCDMLENPIEEIGKGSNVDVSVNNFEIVTLLVRK